MWVVKVYRVYDILSEIIFDREASEMMQIVEGDQIVGSSFYFVVGEDDAIFIE